MSDQKSGAALAIEVLEQRARAERAELALSRLCEAIDVVAGDLDASLRLVAEANRSDSDHVRMYPPTAAGRPIEVIGVRRYVIGAAEGARQEIVRAARGACSRVGIVLPADFGAAESASLPPSTSRPPTT